MSGGKIFEGYDELSKIIIRKLSYEDLSYKKKEDTFCIVEKILNCLCSENIIKSFDIVLKAESLKITFSKFSKTPLHKLEIKIEELSKDHYIITSVMDS